jgi:hypothetical protein
MRSIIGRITQGDSAQDLAEYGIALAVIGAFAAAVVFLISGNVDDIWAFVSGQLGAFVLAV